MTHLLPTHGFDWKHSNSSGYGTHQPVLYQAIQQTECSKHPMASMPILELGCGLFSTELIQKFAGTRKIVSVDSDEAWLDQYKAAYQNDNHEFKLLNFNEMQMSGCYSVVFVDQGCWQSRADSLRHYSASAFFVVLHDSDYLPRELGVDFSKLYYYHKTFMPLQPYPYVTGPPTTILSNFVDVTSWEINYEDYQ